MLDNRKIKGVGFIYTVCCVASWCMQKMLRRNARILFGSWRKMFPSII